jgi:hypothetical protein
MTKKKASAASSRWNVPLKTIMRAAIKVLNRSATVGVPPRLTSVARRQNRRSRLIA